MLVTLRVLFIHLFICLHMCVQVLVLCVYMCASIHLLICYFCLCIYCLYIYIPLGPNSGPCPQSLYYKLPNAWFRGYPTFWPNLASFIADSRRVYNLLFRVALLGWNLSGPIAGSLRASWQVHHLGLEQPCHVLTMLLVISSVRFTPQFAPKKLASNLGSSKNSLRRRTSTLQAGGFQQHTWVRTSLLAIRVALCGT